MLDWLPAGTELRRDVTAAHWIVSKLRPWDPEGVRLESFAPRGFEMYARIFHPAGYRPAFSEAPDPDSGVRWAALGADRGIRLSADVSFSEISGIDPEDQHGLDDIGPSDGQLPPVTCEALERGDLSISAVKVLASAREVDPSAFERSENSSSRQRGSIR